MLTKRVIPCLDIRDGRIVKGTSFANLRDAGDPVERAAAYEAQGADELVVLDVSATPDGREAALHTAEAIRRAISIPLTVGGGVRTVVHARALLEAGADKVGVNSAAVDRPELLTEIAERMGAQCVVLAIDAARAGDSWEVVTRSGTQRTGIDAVAWARDGVAAGAGEILLTSFDQDGRGNGYDLELVRAVAGAVDVSIIASGGASTAAHMAQGFKAGADAVLAASIFHDGVTSVGELKGELAAAGVPVRTMEVAR
ncbi:MAG: imidazole glycerol phosphate synthase subunit HisF [Phycisphaerales bacterium JB060]